MSLQRIRTVVIVSTDPSDLYFANQVARRHEVTGIVLEHQRQPPDGRSRWQKAAALVVRPLELGRRAAAFGAKHWHRWVTRNFLDERAAEFGADGRRLDPGLTAPVLRVEGKGKLNDSNVAGWIRDRQPDLVVVCGASILKAPILAIPPRGVLNLHGGLAQFYRGLFTTDWAILNGEPEKVGATVHFVSEGIDDGGVVFQGRPELKPGDHPNKAYEKVVKLGVEMMSAAIAALDAGLLHQAIDPPRGALYRERDFSDRVKRRLWRRWSRIMENYQQARQARDAVVDSQLINSFHTMGPGVFAAGGRKHGGGTS